MTGQSPAPSSRAGTPAKDLRAKLVALQGDLSRKDRRLTKATARADKLEGLLLQTEGEAVQLRAAAADCRSAVEAARQAEKAAADTLAKSTAHFANERAALVDKGNSLKALLEEKTALAETLRQQVEEARAAAEAREKGLSEVNEKHSALEQALEMKLAEQHARVEQLQKRLADQQHLHDEEVQNITKQQAVQRNLLQENQVQHQSLQGKLQDASVEVFNCQMRLKEERYDADEIRLELERKISVKEKEVAQLNLSVANGSDNNDKISARLETSQKALGLLQAQHAQFLTKSNADYSALQVTLSGKEQELQELKDSFALMEGSYRTKLASVSEDLAALTALSNEKRKELVTTQDFLWAAEKQFQEMHSSLQVSRMEHLKMAKDFQSAISAKDSELRSLSSAASKSAFEIASLKNELHSVRHIQAELDTTSKASMEGLRAQLDLARDEYTQAAAESQMLDEELLALENNIREKDTEIHLLKESVRNQDRLISERDVCLVQLRSEKAELETKSAAQKSQLEKLRANESSIVDSLHSVSAERDALDSCVAELKCEASELVKEAQEDAARQIADATISRQDLEEELEAKTLEAAMFADEVKDMRNFLAKSLNVAQDSTNLKAILQSARSEHVELRGKFQELQVKFQSRDAELVSLTSQKTKLEADSLSQIMERQSIIESRDAAVLGLKEEVVALKVTIYQLEQKDREVTSALSESDALMARAHDENQRLVDSLKESEESGSRALESIKQTLKKTLKSEEEAKRSLKLLHQRLLDLDKRCSLKSSDCVSESLEGVVEKDETIIVNAVVSRIEERIHGGHFLEAQHAQLELDLKALKVQVEDLTNTNLSLKRSCEQAEGKVHDSEEKLQQALDAGNSSAEMLHEQERAAEMTIRGLQRGKEDIENQLSSASAKLEKVCTSRDEMIAKVDELSRSNKAFSERYKKDLLLANDRADSSEREAQHAQEAMRRGAEDAAAAVQAAEKRANDSEVRCKAFENQLEGSKNQVQDLSNSVADLRSKLSESQSVTQTAKAALSKKNEELSTLSNRLEKAESELDEKHKSLEEAGEDLQGMKTVVSSLRERLEAQSTNWEVKLQAVKNEQKEQFDKKAAEAVAEFRAKFSAASANEDRIVEGLRSELGVLEEQNKSLQNKLTLSSEELRASEMSSESAFSSMQHKLDEAVQTQALLQQQRAEAKSELLSMQQDVGRAASENDALRVELSCKKQEVAHLQERLSSAMSSIAALEARVQSNLRDHSSAERETAEIVDKLQSQLDAKCAELSTVQADVKRAETVLRKRLSEVERLSNVVAENARVFNEQTNKLEALRAALDEKSASFTRLEGSNLQEKSLLQAKCDELSQNHRQAEMQLHNMEAAMQKRHQEIDAVKNDLVATQGDCDANAEHIKHLEAREAETREELAKLSAELKTEKAKSLSMSEQLSVSQKVAVELNKELEVSRQDNRDGEGSIFGDLAAENLKLIRTVGKLESSLIVVTRKQRKAEKLLEAAKRKKAVAVSAENSKRQVSPSTKGMSPSLKRVRDQEQRVALSPVATNARPPVAPRSSTRSQLQF